MRVPGTPSKCVFIACLQCKLHAYVSALMCLQCEGLHIGNSILSKVFFANGYILRQLCVLNPLPVWDWMEKTKIPLISCWLQEDGLCMIHHNPWQRHLNIPWLQSIIQLAEWVLTVSKFFIMRPLYFQPNVGHEKKKWSLFL